MALSAIAAKSGRIRDRAAALAFSITATRCGIAT